MTAIEKIPGGWTWAAVSQNPAQLQEICRLQPRQRALFFLAYSQVDHAGHAYFGNQLARQLDAFCGPGTKTTEPTLTRAIQTLIERKLIAPESKRECIILYGNFAQKGRARGKRKLCFAHGPDPQRVWIDDIGPAAPTRTFTVEGEPDTPLLVTNGRTGELLLDEVAASMVTRRRQIAS